MNDIPKNGTRERLGVKQSMVNGVSSGCAHAVPSSVQRVTRCSRQRYSHTKSPSHTSVLTSKPSPAPPQTKSGRRTGVEQA